MSRTDEDVEDLPLDTTEVKTDEQETAVPSKTASKQAAASEEIAAKKQGEDVKVVPSTTDVSKTTRTESYIRGVGEDEEEMGTEVGEECFEMEEEEEESIIYYSEDLISGPYLSEASTIEGNILEFDHSYGYDCKRYYNLVVADPKTIIFLSGNLINFFNVETKEFTFRRSAFGGGLGHCQKNPNPDYVHIAIAENGINPPIIIYEWPSLEVVCLLKGGATRCFSHLNYSPDGELLVSQAGEPDFLITVWNWPRHRILLRTKSYVNDVYRVKFSPYCPGQITTCGLAHIKFWKMATTFTGLKLQGELGRFGKTEYSDILGALPMPDEKVVSGCSWGNILVWDAGLIKVEVFRKLRKTCHDGPIVQIDYRDGELWTVAMDGRVRVWYYDTIDQADPPDDDRVVQIEPVYDFYTPGAEFMCIEKENDNPEDFYYFAQDGNGGLWKIDLSTETDPTPSVQLYKCHAGAVRDIASCPWSHYIASLGYDGRLHLYNYIAKQLIFTHKFPAKGTAMIWLPLTVESSGEEMMLGFDDGNVRVIILSIDDKEDKAKMTLIQVIKPHNKPITCMSLNKIGNILITGGKDSTIFVFKLDKKDLGAIFLTPIGYIKTPGIVTCLTWHLEQHATVIVGCIHGDIVQVEVPTEPQDYTTITYILHLEPKFQKFVTYKAQIRRDIKVAEINARKAIKLEKKMEELEKVKKENPGLEIDEEVFLEDSETEEVLEPLHIPEVPNKILWIQHTVDDTLWLSMGGYDAGYIYEYKIDQKDEIPYRFQIICDGDDIEISSYVYDHNKKYFICAMEDGSIRVNKINPDDFRDLSDYWKLSMHDNYNGFIPKMCFSHDEKYFFSCGYDGNIFSYCWYPEEPHYITEYNIHIKMTPLQSPVPDVKDYSTLSLEETIVKAENDRIQKVANEHKKQLLDKLKQLKETFAKILTQNSQLMPTQIIPREELQLDPRITQHLEDKLNANLELVKRKLAFQVEKSEIGMTKLKKHFTDPLDYMPIRVTSTKGNITVKTLRQRKLEKEFFLMYEVLKQKMIEAEIKGRAPERPHVVTGPPPAPDKKEKQLEYFLMGLSPSTIQFKLGAKLTRLLNKYRMRKVKWERRQHEWDQFNYLKPEEGVNPPEDVIAIEHAESTIGDYKLKSSSSYKVPKHLRESTVKKYQQLLNIREKQYSIRHVFNTKIYELRDIKERLKKYLENLTNELETIHKEIPQNARKFGPPVPQIEENNFPEKQLEVVVNILESSDTTITTRSELLAVVKPPKGDMLEREVLPSIELAEELDDDILAPLSNDSIRVMSEAAFETLLESAANEEEDTPWESELRAQRLNRKLFEQERIIAAMESAIKDFDEHVQKLSYDRLQIQVDANFIDLYLLTLHQELIILKEFEAVEDELCEKVNARIIEMMDMQDLMDEINIKIEGHKREIERLTEAEKVIQQQFFAAVTDNKFYDFLRRIFRKKYKPPKVQNADDSDSDSSSSSSSEESEEQEEGSIDSRDFGIIRLDESVCPKGCDQTLYDLTFSLRSQRHAVELQIREENKNIDTLKKEIEMNFKKIKIIENNLKTSQEEQESFQRLKQHKLNTVLCTVVVKLNQLQHLISANQTLAISDTLIFSRTTLTKLYKRVGQLATETLQQRAKHKVNITHLFRMKTDCKHMEKTIEELNAKIIETSIIKFGKAIDIDEIEEALLKRLVLDLRMSMLDIRSLYESEINLLNEKYAEKQKELLETIQANTARLELLGLLNREKTELAKIIASQQRKKQHLENVVDVSEVYGTEIEKLVQVVKDQRKQIQQLRDEIKRLRTKGMTLKAEKKPKALPFHKHEEAEEIDELFDWSGYDDYVLQMRREAEEMEARKLITTDILIPSVLPEQSEEVAKSIINEMLEALETELSRKSTENFIKQILRTVMNRYSVAEIIDDLIANLPIEPTDEQQSIIEFTAERLYSLQEPEITESDLNRCAMEILAEVLDDTMLAVGEPHEVLARMVTNLIQQLPVSFLLRKESIDTIAGKFGQTVSTTELNQEELIKEVSSLTPSQAEEIYQVIDKVMERVFGSGIDYLYVIKHT